MWVVFAFASAIFAGITAILAKIGIKNTDFFLASALRTIVVAVFAWVMAFISLSGNFGEAFSEIDSGSLLFLFLSALSTGASWLCYFRALQTGDINKVVPVDKSSTALTIILAVPFLGEPISIGKILCITAISAGTYLMIEKKRSPGNKSHNGFLTRQNSILYAAFSAVFAALTSILGKVGVSNISSDLGTAIRTAVILGILWVIVFLQGKHKKIKETDAKSILFLALSGLSTGASWLCYYRALREGDAGIVAPVDKLSILITILFARVIFKEKLSPKAKFGLFGITAGTLALLWV